MQAIVLFALKMEDCMERIERFRQTFVFNIFGFNQTLYVVSMSDNVGSGIVLVNQDYCDRRKKK